MITEKSASCLSRSEGTPVSNADRNLPQHSLFNPKAILAKSCREDSPDASTVMWLLDMELARMISRRFPPLQISILLLTPGLLMNSNEDNSFDDDDDEVSTL